VSTNSTIAAMDSICGCKGKAISLNSQIFYTLFRFLSLIPGMDEVTVEYYFVSEKLFVATRSVTGDSAIVDIIRAITFGTMQLHTVFLPGEGIANTIIISQTIGTLAVIGYELVVITASADDNTVVGTKVIVKLTLLGCG
jgi:hypothetical protein